MSTNSSGGARITGAACVPARYGLLTVAEVDDRSETADHWQLGFQNEVASCDPVIAMSNDCTPTPENKAPSIASYDTFNGDPFTLVAGFECGTIGRPLSEAWQFAEDRLDQAEARAVERVFWTGLDNFGLPIRNGLGSAGSDAINVTPTTGTAVSITDGLALLESFAGEHMSCAPIIHTARGLAVYLAERGLVEDLAGNGKVLYSKGTGSRIAVGGGYLVTGPNGAVAAPGTGWMFVTGSIKVLRSPMFFTPDRGDNAAAVDRQVNNVTVFAERTYGFTRECGLGAVLVNLKAGNC